MRAQMKQVGWRSMAGALVVALGLLGGCAETKKTTAAAKEYMFWPPAPDAPHVQYLLSITSTADITGRQEKMDELLYGKDNTGGLPFYRPYGVRMTDGVMYVCDATTANVSILDFRKKEVRVLGQSGTGRLMKPIDIAVAPDGLKYVADTGLGAVIVFDATDHYAGRITQPNLRPVSVAVYQNELFVSDLKASCVRVFDRMSGKQLRLIGGPGAGGGKMGGAMGLAIDGSGNVYVNDVVGCRVQKFTQDGKFLASMGGIGDHPGTFVRPKHMAVDSAGILYVVDAAFQNVQMFNDKFEMLMFFGSQGDHPGSMDLPTGICVTDQDLDLFASYVHPAFQLQRLVIVTNNFGLSKINVYGLGVLKPGKTVADLAAGRHGGVLGFNDQSQNTETPTTMSDTQPATQAASEPATQPAPSAASQPVGAAGAATSQP